MEFRIIGPLSVTAEAFYSRADYDHTSAGPFFEGPALDAEKHVVGRWEAPLLLKYSFKMRHLTPFLTAGASIQYDRDSNVTEFFGELNIKTIPVGPPLYGFVSTRGPQSEFAGGRTHCRCWRKLRRTPNPSVDRGSLYLLDESSGGSDASFASAARYPDTRLSTHHRIATQPGPTPGRNHVLTPLVPCDRASGSRPLLGHQCGHFEPLLKTQ